MSNTPSFKFLTHALLAAGAVLWLAGCETTGSDGPQAKAEPPMTHARAASECWMGTEKNGARMNLDRRADIVTKCIDDKMKAAAPPVPNSAAPQAQATARPDTRR